MPSPETSVEQMHSSFERALAAHQETNRQILSTLLEIRHQNRPPGSSSVNINAGGISAGIALGMGGVALVVMALFAFWVMLRLSAVQQELVTTRQDLQDQQAAWVTVINQKVDGAKK